MALKTKLRSLFMQLSGYWIYKQQELPCGCDFAFDMKNKLKLPLKVIFDVGANEGQMALRFSDSFPGAAIYSFEPVAETFVMFRLYTAHLPNVKSFPIALAERNGTAEMRLFSQGESVLNSLNPAAMNPQGEPEMVVLQTGDDFCREHHIEEIDLLKIDTEGYEINVLRGFEGMLKASKIKALYCEAGFTPENQRNTYINDLFEFTRQYGYRFYSMYEITNRTIAKGTNFGNLLFLSSRVLEKK